VRLPLLGPSYRAKRGRQAFSFAPFASSM
jgi:hypothetical protein